MPATREELEAKIAQLEKELEELNKRNSYREKDELTMSLLKQTSLRPSETELALQKYDAHLTGGPIFVLAVDFCYRGMLLPKKDMAFAQFLAKNMMDDLFGQEHLVLHTRNGSAYYCLVNLQPENIPARQEILEACEMLVRTLKEQAGFPALICISRQRETITETHIAYQEVEWLRRYLRFTDEEGPVICCDYLQQNASSDLLPQMRELQQDLQTRKYDDASRHAMEILDQLQHGKQLTLDGYESQIYHVITPVLDRISEAMRDGELDSDTGRGLRYSLHQVDSMDALRCSIRNAIQILSDGKAERDQSVPSWMTVLMEKINTGYRNPQMSVNYLADQIGITSVHLSRVFRRVQGTGLMDYIHQLRVEDAKRLIMEGYSVKNAMGIVGYSNQLTMTRAFKRLEGSTPGQYSPAARMSILTEDSSDLQQDLQI